MIFFLNITEQKNPGEPYFMRVPGIFPSLKLGVFFIDINYFRLSFMQIHATFYFNFLTYSNMHSNINQ